MTHEPPGPNHRNPGHGCTNRIAVSDPSASATLPFQAAGLQNSEAQP